MARIRVAARLVEYSTTLPTSRGSGRHALATASSVVLHLLLVLLAVRLTTRPSRAAEARRPEATEQPIQLYFAPPRPKPTERPKPPEDLSVPLTPGHDATPGSIAQVAPKPETDPNAAPDTRPSSATSPDPDPGRPGASGAPRASAGDASPNDRPPPAPQPAPTALAAAPNAAATAPTLESEARRIFGRPSTKLGPLAGSRDNRPWESPIPLSSGCTLPPADPNDSLPPGMGQVAGVIYREDNGQPLPGARLQILGTPYGTFANGRGEYRLVFDRSLVDGCRTQAVRVSAPGYRSRDVILYLGNRPNSDVSLPRY